MGYDKAVVCGGGRCGLYSYCTGDEAGKHDGENGCMDDEFHKLDYLRYYLNPFYVEERDKPEYSAPKPVACVFSGILEPIYSFRY
jgi:hypothetical protein